MGRGYYNYYDNLINFIGSEQRPDISIVERATPVVVNLLFIGLMCGYVRTNGRRIDALSARSRYGWNQIYAEAFCPRLSIHG